MVRLMMAAHVVRQLDRISKTVGHRAVLAS